MTSRYVEAPTYYEPQEEDPPAVFVAGGITGVPNFQAIAARELADGNCVVLNPRRANYPAGEPNAVREQVRWECHHRKLDQLGHPLVTMFWFPGTATPQPIALLELGAALARPRSARLALVVGADPAYSRRADVVLQCEFDRPDLIVHDTLHATLHAVRTVLPALSRPYRT